MFGFALEDGKDYINFDIGKGIDGGETVMPFWEQIDQQLAGDQIDVGTPVPPLIVNGLTTRQSKGGRNRRNLEPAQIGGFLSCRHAGCTLSAIPLPRRVNGRYWQPAAVSESRLRS